TVAFDEVGGIKVKDQDTIQIMKDYMANGRFSRGVEVIADASLAFVGNLDLSVSQIVNSEMYDLFQPLPKEFDLAVMDRFAMYLPGWEMPKNSSEFLTDHYGFITDYLAEAFHFQLKHTNRYDEVNSRIHLGNAVEGRDEKGIKKAVAAFLKILHPTGTPSDDEFEEYVAYAVECRRRVKEQMNKRKPDDEFARINLSFINKQGKERVVYCPESKSAPATQDPVRRNLDDDPGTTKGQRPKERPETVEKKEPDTASNGQTESEPVSREMEKLPEIVIPELKEQHYTIHYGATGYSYESIITPYLTEAKTIEIDDPYIRAPHQVQNFVRFCEAVIKTPTIKKITLCTSYDDQTNMQELSDRLNDVKQSLIELDLDLDIKINEHLHDREIRIDNGWTIKIGRGLDFYQKPESWFTVGAHDLSLKKCLETKIDIFKRPLKP
ncbi:MAG: BREX system Lon protease-like protein BrxL, partial [Desulfobacteraceae bacterium]|nr:BREX system Lon protease-like protein BrxL [Desulfobacteraceae bacterium]